MAEKEKKQQMKETAKTNEIPVQYRLEKTFEEAVKLLHQLREEAIKENDWREIRLWEYSGYILEISIAPDGNPVLKLVSPSLKNNFTIASAEIYHVIIELAKTLEYNKDVIMNLIGVCQRYSTRKKYKRRHIV